MFGVVGICRTARSEPKQREASLHFHLQISPQRQFAHSSNHLHTDIPTHNLSAPTENMATNAPIQLANEEDARAARAEQCRWANVDLDRGEVIVPSERNETRTVYMNVQLIMCKQQ
jgi:hypothetical protein